MSKISLTSPAELVARLGVTSREAEVLTLLAAGRANKQIARNLGISRHTVVRHLEHIYAKLDVNNRAEAARIAPLGTRIRRTSPGRRTPARRHRGSCRRGRPHSLGCGIQLKLPARQTKSELFPFWVTPPMRPSSWS